MERVEPHELPGWNGEGREKEILSPRGGTGLSGHSTAVPPIARTVRANAAFRTLTPLSHPERTSVAISSNSKAAPVNHVAAAG